LSICETHRFLHGGKSDEFRCRSTHPTALRLNTTSRSRAMTNDFLSKFPIKKRPSNKEMKKFIRLFIEHHPDIYSQLRISMEERRDLAPIMVIFFEFLQKNNFSDDYAKDFVFSAMCDLVRADVHRENEL
jgi:hypothetical protein